MDLLLAACGAGWGVGLLILAGFFATSSVGVTGGPNHGEHPFIVNLVHLGVAAFYATKGWPGRSRGLYLGLLGVAVVFSLLIVGLREHREPRPVWAARAVMIALYLGLLAIVLWGR